MHDEQRLVEQKVSLRNPPDFGVKLRFKYVLNKAFFLFCPAYTTSSTPSPVLLFNIYLKNNH